MDRTVMCHAAYEYETGNICGEKKWRRGEKHSERENKERWKYFVL